MKLIIQIPCYNEAETLAETVAQLPKKVDGFDEVEYLVIDDGSTDDTVEVAKKAGVHHIFRHYRNKGLAAAFKNGLAAAMQLGADVVVNTDADNQYNAEDIQKLVDPILQKKAELVVGARPISEIAHFSPLKKKLQHLGSWVVRLASNTDISDAPSGFRAISKNAAGRLLVYNNYTYTLETIIQAGQSGMTAISVPIRVNGETRPSRLFKSNFSYVWRSVRTILNIFVLYRPVQFFFTLGLAFLIPGLLIGCRFLYYYFLNDGAGHVQSLILASILAAGGGGCFIMGVIGHLLSANRRLLEEIRFRLNSQREKLEIWSVDENGSDRQ